MGKMFVNMSRASERGGAMNPGPMDFRAPMNFRDPSIAKTFFFLGTHRNPEKIVAFFSEGLCLFYFGEHIKIRKCPIFKLSPGPRWAFGVPENEY